MLILSTSTYSLSSGHRYFLYDLLCPPQHDRRKSKSGLKGSGGVRSSNKETFCLFLLDSVTEQEKCFVKHFQPQFTKENLKDWFRANAICKIVLSSGIFQLMHTVNLLAIMVCFEYYLGVILSP